MQCIGFHGPYILPFKSCTECLCQPQQQASEGQVLTAYTKDQPVHFSLLSSESAQPAAKDASRLRGSAAPKKIME